MSQEAADAVERGRRHTDEEVAELAPHGIGASSLSVPTGF